VKYLEGSQRRKNRWLGGRAPSGKTGETKPLKRKPLKRRKRNRENLTWVVHKDCHK
jgi:hypothetical protein